MPAPLVPKMFELIVTLGIAALCQWDFRIVWKLTNVPFLLLLIVERPPFVYDARRRGVAQQLLNTDDASLSRLFQFSDVTVKLKHVFMAAFMSMCLDGYCDPDLHCALLLLRWAWRADSQLVEGLNNVPRCFRKIYTIVCRTDREMHTGNGNTHTPPRMG